MKKQKKEKKKDESDLSDKIMEKVFKIRLRGTQVTYTSRIFIKSNTQIFRNSL